MLLSLPVFTFVVAVLVYSILRFRGRGPTEEGHPFRSHTGVAVAWLMITSALAIFVVIHPGLTGLAQLHADQTHDLEVQVIARQWNWSLIYPQYDLTLRRADEMILPLGRRVRIEVTSEDVVHAFWVPAFRLKTNAVPGLVTTLHLTPNRKGDFASDFNYRVQCAELCGTGHASMDMRLAVVEPSEFEAWIAQTKARQPDRR